MTGRAGRQSASLRGFTGNRRVARLGLAGALCGLLAAAWALAQAPAGSEAAAVANREPVVLANAPDGGLAVHAGERASLAVEALDPDVLADGTAEPVWLSAAFSADAGQGLPSWLAGTAWSSELTPGPRLEIGLAPPKDAAPGVHVLVVGATDARGMSTVRTYPVTVRESRCGPLEVRADGACRTCGEHEVPDASGRACEPCPAGTERPVGAEACMDCAPGLASGPGEACGCGPMGLLDGGICVACPPDTERSAAGDACVACPAGTERPAGAAACTDCPPEAACAVVRTAAKSAALGGAGAKAASQASGTADTVAPTIGSAAYAGSTVTLAMSEPVWAEAAPAAGDFALAVLYPKSFD